MGATGHIGHAIVEELLKRGHIVRAIGRSEEKLHHLEQKGAEVYSINFDDSKALADCFKDCYAVFTMIPPAISEKNYASYQDKVTNAIWWAIDNSGIKRVVNLSSIGADLDKGTGLIKGLHRLEEKLNTLKNLDVLVHLRPDFFMENLDNSLATIKDRGIIYGPLDRDLPIPMVATRDIGWKAADFLDSTAPLGHIVFEFVGPKEVTMNHVAEVLAWAFDHPNLTYEQISMDQFKTWLLDHGMQPDTVDLMVEMYESFNSGLIVPSEEIKATHRGITSFEEYAQMIAHKMFSLAH